MVIFHSHVNVYQRLPINIEGPYHFSKALGRNFRGDIPKEAEWLAEEKRKQPRIHQPIPQIRFITKYGD